MTDYEPDIQQQLKQSDPEVSPGLWQGDIAGASVDVGYN